ncbi:hypothetical protein F8388_003375 [Cannabis sativa]|uniref:Uncharacterized protein n=1 Tax=Cannabis sativa TaxID=3483 RepID=A0A7J6FDC5_CANSA|nr:hypothetical protein F8388_003375 [Cannabis sativa]
MFQKRKKKVL